MGDSRKGISSTVSTKNLNAPNDEDFDKDFLTSWKSVSLGKNTIDFDMETLPKTKKIKFDKLDDFELDSNFDKLPSFKMDISDLDFSTPLKKSEKRNKSTADEHSSGKRDYEKDFFSFDFNDLGSFSIDGNLDSIDKESNKTVGESNIMGPPSKKEFLKGINTGNSNDVSAVIITNDAREVSELQDSLKTGQGHLRNANPHSEILKNGNLVGLADEPSKVHLPTKEVSKKVSDVNAVHLDKEHMPTPDMRNSDCFSRLSSPNEDSVQAEVCEKSAELLMDNEHNNKEVDNFEQSMRNLESRSSSPLKSQTSEGPVDDVINVPSHNDAVTKTRDSGRSLAGKFLQKKSSTVKNSVEINCNSSSPKIVSSLLNRDSQSLKTSSDAQEETFGFLRSLDTKATKLPQIAAPSSMVELCAQGKSDTAKDLTVERKRIGLSSSHVPLSTSPGGTLVSTTPNAVSSSAVPWNIKKTITKSPLASLSTSIDEKGLKVSNVTTQRLTKLDGRSPATKSLDKIKESKDNAPNTAISLSRLSKLENLSLSSKLLKETKEIKENALQRTVSLLNSVTAENKLLSPPLKRKTPEDSLNNGKAIQPLKRMMSSSGKGEMPKVSPIIEAEKDAQKETSKACPDFLTLGPNGAESISHYDVPVVLESDRNVQKAEACSRDLEDICSMLRKKHEEAKELLVRAIVNNNALLMLNHPMYEEKILAVQKFAANLRSKEYAF